MIEMLVPRIAGDDSPQMTDDSFRESTSSTLNPVWFEFSVICHLSSVICHATRFLPKAIAGAV